MEVTVKKLNGLQRLIVEEDFNNVLDNNLDEIIDAIANKGKVLKELIALYEKDPELSDKIIYTIRKSRTTDDAYDNLRKKLSMSKRVARYILNLSLGDFSFSVQEIKEQLACYKQKIEKLK